MTAPRPIVGLDPPSEPLTGGDLLVIEHVLSGGGTDTWGVRLDQHITEFVLARWKGAVGDDTVDDLLALQAAIDAATPGGIVLLEHGKVYKLTDALQLKAGVWLMLNGSTLRFVLAGDKEALQIRGNNCGVTNGTITVVGSGLTGVGGNWHTPINVGQVYANIGYTGVFFRHLTINGDRVNGNGILVTADSANVRIEDTTFPDSATMGRPILIHWGGDGGVPPALTTHPNNVTVDGLVVGDMTYNGADLAAVFVSAAYNVHVRNVTVKGIYDSVVSVVAGDYGFERAAAAIKPLANQAITFDGVTCQVARGYGVYVNSVADNQAGAPVITTPVLFRNVKTKGIGAGATRSGFRAREGVDVVLENCEFSHHLRGFEIEESAKRIWIRGGRAFNNEEHGVYASHGSNPMDCLIEGVHSYLNGQAAGFWAGIYIGSTQRFVVRNCHVGHPVSETNQIYGIRTDSGATALSLIDNDVYNTMAGGIGYSLGSSGDDGQAMIWEFRGNRAGAAVPNFRTGLDRIPIRRRLAGAGAQVVITEYQGDASIPSSGTYVTGDMILADVPASNGNPGIICVTGNSLGGAWKALLVPIAVGPTAPSNPAINDLWVDTA